LKGVLVSMKMTAGEIATACGGQILTGSPETLVTSVTTDSRQVKQGTLFVPIVGEKIDAHQFIGKALEAGASAVLTQEHQTAQGPGVWIAVDDTRAALQKIAAEWRKRFNGSVVGITGSVGKTTTKEMTALALSAGMKVMKTEGNQNSQIGLPLTMFRLSPEYDAAVIEMGMSEFGEMSRLAAVASPDYAVLTNIGLSHIGNLGSQENIRKEKLHITDRFHEKSVLFLNGDDPLLAELRGKLPFRTVYFGTQPWCDFRAESVRIGAEASDFRYFTPDGRSGSIHLPVPGIHCVLDALAGLAVADQLGVSLKKAAQTLSTYQPLAMRMQIRRASKGYTVIDDSYNSSPDAAKSSLSVLAGFHSGKRVAVLADMLELGDFSRQGHFSVGEYAANEDIEVLVTVGEEAKEIAEGALSVNPKMQCHVCKTNAEALDVLSSVLEPGDTVLVKGSRGMKTDEIVKQLL
jgi:UDP-N-acetylmuramoyl-tripeptide--D-alanyl-D-alanine ligase